MSRTFHARGPGMRHRNHATWFAKHVRRDGYRAERELDPVRTLVLDGYYEFVDTLVEKRADVNTPWCLSSTRLDYSSMKATWNHEEDMRLKTAGRVRGRRRSKEGREREFDEEMVRRSNEWMRANGYSI